jgi:hypothetical protein
MKLDMRTVLEWLWFLQQPDVKKVSEKYDDYAIAERIMLGWIKESQEEL